MSRASIPALPPIARPLSEAPHTSQAAHLRAPVPAASLQTAQPSALAPAAPWPPTKQATCHGSVVHVSPGAQQAAHHGAPSPASPVTQQDAHPDAPVPALTPLQATHSGAPAPASTPLQASHSGAMAPASPPHAMQLFGPAPGPPDITTLPPPPTIMPINLVLNDHTM